MILPRHDSVASGSRRAPTPSDLRPPTSDLRPPASDFRPRSRLCHGSSLICHGSAQKPAFKNANVFSVLASDHPNINQCSPCCHGFGLQKSPSLLLVTGVTG